MINHIIDFSLHNRLLMLVLAFSIMAMGLLSYQKLPVDAFPDVSPNLVQVFTITEGLAPEEVEMYVTYPLEAAMAGLPGTEKFDRCPILVYPWSMFIFRILSIFILPGNWSRRDYRKPVSKYPLVSANPKWALFLPAWDWFCFII